MAPATGAAPTNAFPDARYRHPIEPLMLMLAVYTVGLSLQARVRVSQK